MEPKRVGDLQIEHNQQTLRTEWRAQRVAWVLFALIILAALLGAFGSGPLSSARISDDAAGLAVQYERITRWDTPMTVRVTMLPLDQHASSAWLSVSNSFLENVPVEWINPLPLRSLSRADRTLYEFPIGEHGSGTITFEFRPDRFGRHRLLLGRDDRPELSLGMYVLP